jgi:CheY-like chemotaxis protein
MMLKALSQILASEARFTVVGSATDGYQALRYATSLEPELVLMGAHLSKLTGGQVARRIKQSRNPPVVFMLDSDNSPSSRVIIDAAGADAFVATTTDLEAGLKSTLREWFSPNSCRTPKRLEVGPTSPGRVGNRQQRGEAASLIPYLTMQISR